MFTLSELIDRNVPGSELFSDLHKDCYGFRPHGFTFASVDAFVAEYEHMATVVLPREIEREQAARARAVAEFEVSVARVMATVQDCTRARAIRFLADAEGCGEDWEEFEYELGLPFGYVESQMGRSKRRY